MRVRMLGLGLALCLPCGARAQSNDRVETFGAVASPVALPPGGAATYGYVGVPEVGAGYRLGVGAVELEGRLRFNYFDVSIAGEALLKYAVYHQGRWDAAPIIGLGLVGNAGATYIDTSNFSYFGLRVLPGGILGYRLADSVRALAEVDVPVDVALNAAGGSRIGALAGGGAEIYIGEDVSALLLAQGGFEALKPPNTAFLYRFDYQVTIGLGWRLF
jgi:hypothetical protein